MRKIFLFLFAAVLSIGTAMAEVVTITENQCTLEYEVLGENALMITGDYLGESFALTLINEDGIDLTAESFVCDVQSLNIANYSKYADRGTATVTVYPMGISISATGLYDFVGDDPNTYDLVDLWAEPKSSAGAGGEDIAVEGEFTVDMTGLEATFDPLLTFAASGQSDDMSLGAPLGTVVTYLECSWAEVDGAYPVDLANSYLTLADHGMVGEVLGGSVVPVMDAGETAIVSATAVVYVYFADLESTLKFTLNMTAGSSEEPGEPGEPGESSTVSVQVWNATLSEEWGTLMVNGSMNGVAVHAEVPGFVFEEGVWQDYPYSDVMVEVGTYGESDYLGFATGDATVELDQNTVTITGTMTTSGGTTFVAYIQGSLQPADPMTSTALTLEGMTKSEIRNFIQLADDNYNTIEIYGSEYGDYLKVTASIGEDALEGYGSWNVVDGVETLVATLYDKYYTKVYHVTATVSAQQTFTLTSWDATYVVDPEFGDVIFSGVAEEGGEFEIMVGNTVEGQYAYGYWGETEIVATEFTYELDIWDDSYMLEGTFMDDANNIYEVGIIAYAPVPDYTRPVTVGDFGTICLPFGGEIEGAELYELVKAETNGVLLGSVETLEAGVPYIFKATATELAVYSDGTTAAAGSHNGLHGTFTDDTEVAVGNYIVHNNALCEAETTCYVDANRAYVVWSEIPTTHTPMPGRRYIGMSTQGENEATGLDNIATSENAVKVINNGQLIIIRGGEKFNAQGQKL